MSIDFVLKIPVVNKRLCVAVKNRKQSLCNRLQTSTDRQQRMANQGTLGFDGFHSIHYPGPLSCQEPADAAGLDAICSKRKSKLLYDVVPMVHCVCNPSVDGVHCIFLVTWQYLQVPDPSPLWSIGIFGDVVRRSVV